MNETEGGTLVAGEGNRREVTIHHPDLRIGVSVFVLALLDLLVIRKARLQKVVDIHNLPIELDRSVVTRNEVAAAIEYVLNDDYDWPVSFVCVCGLLALDTDATRESLMELVEDSKNPYVKAGLRIYKAKRHAA